LRSESQELLSWRAEPRQRSILLHRSSARGRDFGSSRLRGGERFFWQSFLWILILFGFHFLWFLARGGRHKRHVSRSPLPLQQPFRVFHTFLLKPVGAQVVVAVSKAMAKFVLARRRDASKAVGTHCIK